MGIFVHPRSVYDPAPVREVTIEETIEAAVSELQRAKELTINVAEKTGYLAFYHGNMSYAIPPNLPRFPNLGLVTKIEEAAKKEGLIVEEKSRYVLDNVIANHEILAAVYLRVVEQRSAAESKQE